MPAHNRIYNKTCVTSKESDKPVHPASMPLYNQEAVEGTCNQRRLCSDCADAQADLSPRWSAHAETSTSSVEKKEMIVCNKRGWVTLCLGVVGTCRLCSVIMTLPIHLL